MAALIYPPDHLPPESLTLSTKSTRMYQVSVPGVLESAYLLVSVRLEIAGGHQPICVRIAFDRANLTSWVGIAIELLI
jgi:hypothetical protein